MGLSPMMMQYQHTKEKYKDAILFYRLGDFYEMFFEDAELVSRELELTLTGRDCGLEKRAPMCGIPHHASESYIAKLLEKGYKVAICEQLTEPQKGSKLVEWDVVRIITPGTLMDSSMLDESRNNYDAAIYKNKNNIGIYTIDISTGKFFATEFTGEKIFENTNDYLASFRPSEVIVNNDMVNYYNTLPSVSAGFLPVCYQYDEMNFNFENACERIKNQYSIESLIKTEINNKEFAIIASGALLNYIFDTQKRQLQHISEIEYFSTNEHMQLDANTRRNLELTETLKDKKKRGTLYWVLNKTKTSMGSRLLKSYIDQPLYNDKLINNRLQAVEELIKNIVIREKLGDLLYRV